MASCEMCGSSGQMFIAIIEGAQLSVCEKCSGLGKIIKQAPPAFQKEKRKPPSSQARPPQKRTVQVIVGDYAKRIRQARERSGLSQKEFAMKLNERESVIAHLENGQSKPSVDSARKLERSLGIKLIESVEEEVQESEDSEDQERSGGTLTLGDVIKIRKR